MMTTEEWNDKPAGDRGIRTAAEMREAAAQYHQAIADAAAEALDNLSDRLKRGYAVGHAMRIERDRIAVHEHYAAAIRALPIAPAVDREELVDVCRLAIAQSTGECDASCPQDDPAEICECQRDARAVIAALEAAGALK